MPRRALVIGFLLAMFIAGCRYFNDYYMGQTDLVDSNLPQFAFGVLILISLLLNTWRNRFRFSSRELALILAMMFSVCCIPKAFIGSLIMPHYWKGVYVNWRETKAIEQIPDKLMVQVENPAILDKFILGTPKNTTPNVPWQAWLGPLKIWVPFYCVLMLGFIGLAMVFHRQWVEYEHLTYPIAEFATYIFGNKQAEQKSLFLNRYFWFGIIPAAIYYIVNWLNSWHPNWIQFPHRVDFTAFAEFFPSLADQFEAGRLWNPDIRLPVIAFAYFLPAQITLSLGLTHLLSLIVGALCLTYGGYYITREHAGPGDIQGILVGAFIGQALLIFYTGRAYYFSVLTKALGIKRDKTAAINSSAVWGLRVFVFSFIVACIMMMNMGLPLAFAILMFLLIALMYIVIGRISAETGLYVIYPWWLPGGVLLGIFGAYSMGPKALAICMLISVLVVVDPRECFMPFILNALRIGEKNKISKATISKLMVILMILGMVLASGTTIWIHYKFGNPTNQWPIRWAPCMPGNTLAREIQDLKLADTLAEAQQLSIAERFQSIKPKKEFVYSLLFGFLAFAICSILRLRITKWPIHPVLFPVWFTGPMARFWFSFLVGWLIKGAIVRLGGQPVYQRFKPFMVGVIAAALLTGFMFMVFGAFYYKNTGFSPPSYSTVGVH